ncbi:MAG TPA: PEP/pyruvate-binding domain-containing protein [Patescibacteria group bacterium]
MTQSLLSSLHTSVLPGHEIGQVALRLTQAIDQAVPVAPTAIIPLSTLQEIAEYNQLPDKVARTSAHLHFDDQHQIEAALGTIKRATRQQHIPEHLRKHLTNVYDQQLGQEWVQITASFFDPNRTESLVHTNVKGDVNLFESLLSLWAEAITIKHQAIDVFPAAFVIQAQPQPQASGFVYTAHPATGNKTRYLVESLHGVFDERLDRQKDIYEIDTHTHNVVKSETGIQDSYLERTLDDMVERRLTKAEHGQPSLTMPQLRQLGEWTTKLKTHFLSQLKIEWQLINDKLQITSITPFTLTATAHTQRQEILVIGDSFIGGYIQGTCCIEPTQQSTFSAGNILVVNRLTKAHQGLIRQAAAIVTEHPITDSLLTQLINYYHIPTVINATHATRRLTTNQEVIVDASGGKVIKHSTSTPNLRTATKVISVINNPYTSLGAYADGYYFKSDFSFLTDALSPQEVVISSQGQALKVVLAKRLSSLTDQPLWYRVSCIHQGQLSLKAKSPEESEPNPYFGRRGALFHLAEPGVLHFEIEVLKKILVNRSQPLRVVLPFVRTPAERELLIYQLQAALGELMSRVEIWLELVNPESIINLPQYLSLQVKGVILPVTHLHALWYGLDPENPALLKHYPLNGEFITQLLALVMPHTKQVMVELNRPHSSLLEKVVARGITLLATKQNHLKNSKEQLHRLEERLIVHGDH